MNLRDQLKEILPEILPRNPNQAIKGTELIESVKNKLKQEYSDATLRYHFSIMSCDPSSPIAKVAQGQGYYLRTETIHSMNSAMNMISTGPEAFTTQNSDTSIARASKFRAVVQRYFESIHHTPFSFEESFSENAHFNRWIVPDLAVVKWKTAKPSDDGLILDREEMDVYRRMSLTPVEINSAKLRLELNHHDLFEDLYQCLATSEWANCGQLVVAAPISPHMREQVTEFSRKYGIGVTSFNLDADIIDDFPEPAAIENLMPEEFESIRSLFDVHTITAAANRPVFDWEHVTNSSGTNADFDRFERWLSSCLMEERIISPRDFIHQERSTTVAAVA